LQIADVEGIGAAHASRLAAADIHTGADLLAAGATRDGRTRLAIRTGIREQVLLSWVNHIDLAQLAGVGPGYANLLEAAGIDCCAELAKRDAEHLAATMIDLVATRATVRRAPDRAEIARWIELARKRAGAVEQ
jgi:predicted flap endonuclease-1-like 5' DNA nuclease